MWSLNLLVVSHWIMLWAGCIEAQHIHMWKPAWTPKKEDSLPHNSGSFRLCGTAPIDWFPGKRLIVIEVMKNRPVFSIVFNLTCNYWQILIIYLYVVEVIWASFPISKHYCAFSVVLCDSFSLLPQHCLPLCQYQTNLLTFHTKNLTWTSYSSTYQLVHIVSCAQVLKLLY